MFVDSHAHLEGDRYDADRDQVFQRAASAGVAAVLCIGNADAPDGFDCAIQLARRYPNVYATVGIHPHEAKLGSEELYARLAALARHEKVIAWGEVGLDYYYDHAPRELQKQVFARQLQLACTASLPVVIHCRPSENSDNAWHDTFDLLRQHGSGPPGIIHCFTGNVDHMRSALELGFTVSFSGAVTFPNAENIRAAARECPLDRILIETDSPFLAPVPFRGRRNEPAYLLETAKKVAQLRGISLEEFAQATTANFKRLFRLA